MRLGIFALALLLATGPAQAASTYNCADAEGEVSVVFDYDLALAEPFTRIEMQITDDYGLSTVPGARNNDGEFVSAHYAGKDFIGADVMWRKRMAR